MDNETQSYKVTFSLAKTLEGDLQRTRQCIAIMAEAIGNCSSKWIEQRMKGGSITLIVTDAQLGRFYFRRREENLASVLRWFGERHHEDKAYDVRQKNDC